MTDLPDFLQPAPDPEGSYEALLERVQRVEALAETDGWRDFCDFLLSMAHAEERTVVAGHLDHDEYLRRTSRINALLLAADAPKLMRQMAENRRPPAQQEA